MYITKHYSLATADIVLAMMQKDAHHVAPRKEIYVSAFDNGREQGYKIEAGGVSIAWAKYRSSDTIVVYYWTNDFEKAHPNSYDTPAEAADKILKTLDRVLEHNA